MGAAYSPRRSQTIACLSIPVLEGQLSSEFIPSSAALWVQGEGLGELQCCRNPHSQGPGAHISALKTPREQNRRRPAQQHLFLLSLPSARKRQKRKTPAEGTSLTSSVTFLCSLCSLTEPGRVLSIPSRLHQYQEAPPAPSRGSSSSLLLTFSSPYGRASSYSKCLSLEAWNSSCTSTRSVCGRLA